MRTIKAGAMSAKVTKSEFNKGIELTIEIEGEIKSSDAIKIAKFLYELQHTIDGRAINIVHYIHLSVDSIGGDIDGAVMIMNALLSVQIQSLTKLDERAIVDLTVIDQVASCAGLFLFIADIYRISPSACCLFHPVYWTQFSGNVHELGAASALSNNIMKKMNSHIRSIMHTNYADVFKDTFISQKYSDGIMLIEDFIIKTGLYQPSDGISPTNLQVL